MAIYSDAAKDRLQKNLSVIRKVAGWTAQDLGDLIGVSKQTISNIETGRAKLTKTQYIAIRAVLDCEISSIENEEIDSDKKNRIGLRQIVSALLDTDDLDDENKVKLDTVITYATGAKASGMSQEAISVGVASLIIALGFSIGTIPGLLAVSNTKALWLEAILAAKKGNKKKGGQ